MLLLKLICLALSYFLNKIILKNLSTLLSRLAKLYLSVPTRNNPKECAAHLYEPKDIINIHLSGCSTMVYRQNPSKHISLSIQVPLVALKLYTVF